MKYRDGKRDLQIRSEIQRWERDLQIRRYSRYRDGKKDLQIKSEIQRSAFEKKLHK